MVFAVASNNPGKLREIQRILDAGGHEAKSQRELGYDFEVEETARPLRRTPISKPRPSAGAAGCRPSQTTPASASMRWTVHRESIPPATAAARGRRGKQRQTARGAG